MPDVLTARQGKLQTLASCWGDVLASILEAGVSDGVCAGICVNEGCDYCTEVEPDCTDGWCEICRTNSVSSALVLAYMI